MGNFKVFNVKGDGSCYYRCVWRLAKEHSYIADALYVNNREDEERGAEEVREYVALSLKYEKPTKDYLKNLVELYKEVPELIQNYPLLGFINVNDNFDDICKTIADRVENSKMMASSLEHEVIANRLSTVSYDSACDLNIVILTQHDHMDVDDLAEKWLLELSIILPKLTCDDVAIFINEDNIHYKYAKFDNEIVIKRKSFIGYINSVINDDSTDSD